VCTAGLHGVCRLTDAQLLLCSVLSCSVYCSSALSARVENLAVFEDMTCSSMFYTDVQI
jgi:hypothetical protein